MANKATKKSSTTKDTQKKSKSVATTKKRVATAKKVRSEVVVAPQTEVVQFLPEEATAILLKFVYENAVSNNMELSEKTGVPLDLIEQIEVEKDLNFVKNSQFKDTFKISLEMNCRNISLMIDSLTRRSGDGSLPEIHCDPFKLQKLTQALKTLRELQRSEDPSIVSSKLPAGSGSERVLRVHQIVELIERKYEQGKVN